MGGIAAASLAIAMVAGGFAFGSDDPSSQPPQETSPTSLASTSDVSPCIDGLGQTTEGQQAIERSAEEYGLPTPDDCALVDAAIDDLKSIESQTPLRMAQLKTPVGAYGVWVSVNAECDMFIGTDIEAAQRVDTFARYLQQNPKIGDGMLDDDLAQVAVLDGYAVKICPKYGGKTWIAWSQRNPAPSTLTLDSYVRR